MRQETTNVILVDDQDSPIGEVDKLLAHQSCLRHSAFSIFIFRYHNYSLQLLMQQRAKQKYHSGGLWSNTCCSHQIKNQPLIPTALLRLQEEIGIQAFLKYLGWFHYECEVGNGLFENENDHLLIGVMRGSEIKLNNSEVENVKWVDWNEVKSLAQQNSPSITAWLKPAVDYLQRLISDHHIIEYITLAEG